MNYLSSGNSTQQSTRNYVSEGAQEGDLDYIDNPEVPKFGAQRCIIQSCGPVTDSNVVLWDDDDEVQWDDEDNVDND